MSGAVDLEEQPSREGCTYCGPPDEGFLFPTLNNLDVASSGTKLLNSKVTCGVTGKQKFSPVLSMLLKHTDPEGLEIYVLTLPCGLWSAC